MRVSAFIVSAVFVSVSLAIAGPLTPPVGPVVATGKTVSEIEPRTIINAVNTPGDANALFRITAPGSYYLTGPITGVAGKNGIVIAASNVTIDLCGFTVTGVASALRGIMVDAASTYADVTLRNGSVIGWDTYAVDFAGNFGTRNCIIEDVHASNCKFAGLRASSSGIIRNCTAGSIGPSPVVGVGSYGIIGTSDSLVENCRVSAVQGYGIASYGGIIRGCSVSNSTKDGISQIGGGLITECVSYGSTGFGISTTQDGSLGGNSHISNCEANGNTAGGIQVGTACTVSNCTANSNGSAGAGIGILANGSGNRIDSNLVVSNRVGIQLTAAGNIMMRNAARTNVGGNYSFVGGNDIGPIGTAATSGSAWANFSF